MSLHLTVISITRLLVVDRSTGLALFGKEEKDRPSGGKKGAKNDVFHNVPGKIRMPGGQPVEFVVEDLNADYYDFDAFRIYPIRSLLPETHIAGYIGESYTRTEAMQDLLVELPSHP